jgi:hypothetical protein
VFFDFLTSTKRPESDTPALPAQQVLAKLKALSRPTAPWHVIDGQHEGVDLIAEWRIVDAGWLEVFAPAGLTKVFRIFLKIDADTRQIRAQDREYSVEWSTGVPKLSLAASAFKGQSHSVQFGASYGFVENMNVGHHYKYYFKTSEIKTPLQEAVTSCGWVYKGVAFGKL